MLQLTKLFQYLFQLVYLQLYFIAQVIKFAQQIIRLIASIFNVQRRCISTLITVFLNPSKTFQELFDLPMLAAEVLLVPLKIFGHEGLTWSCRARSVH